MPTFTETIIFAAQCHNGRLDPANKAPAILHNLRLVSYMGHPIDDAAMHVALLHDVIQDCQVTALELRSLGYGEEIIDAVVALTQTPDELADGDAGFNRYILRCAESTVANRVVPWVKYTDIIDRLNQVFYPITEADIGTLEKLVTAVNLINSVLIPGMPAPTESEE